MSLKRDPKKILKQNQGGQNQKAQNPGATAGKQAGGALNKDPRFTVGNNAARLDQQEQHIQRQLAKNPGSKVANQRMKQINAARGALSADPTGVDPITGLPSNGPGATPPNGGSGQTPPPVDPTQPTPPPVDPTQPNPQPPPDPTQPNPNPQPPPNPNQTGFDGATTGANAYLNQTFQQMQNQGPFNPGNFMDSRQKASDTAMNEFNRQNQGRFKQEDSQFAQQMADQGIDENSEKYRYMKGQNDLNRGNQIQGAQNNAFQLGQGEQAQAYNQASSTYQMPLNQLNAVSPFYGYQNQNQMQQGMQNWQGGQNQMDRQQQTNMQQGMQGWQGGQNDMDRQNQMNMQQSGFGFQGDQNRMDRDFQNNMQNSQFGFNNQSQQQGFDFQSQQAKRNFEYQKYLQAHQKGGGGGGGGLSFEQQMQLQNNALDKNFYNSMVLNGLQGSGGPPSPSASSGFSQGIGAGIGAGVTAGLIR